MNSDDECVGTWKEIVVIHYEFLCPFILGGLRTTTKHISQNYRPS